MCRPCQQKRIAQGTTRFIILARNRRCCSAPFHMIWPPTTNCLCQHRFHITAQLRRRRGGSGRLGRRACRIDMDVGALPNPTEFTERRARSYRDSKSATGKFGFPVQTCDGDRAPVVGWQGSWSVFCFCGCMSPTSSEIGPGRSMSEPSGGVEGYSPPL